MVEGTKSLNWVLWKQLDGGKIDWTPECLIMLESKINIRLLQEELIGEIYAGSFIIWVKP